ncbi:MAG: hypothetical protein WDN28_20325 [Chthoniobacter sp.]
MPDTAAYTGRVLAGESTVHFTEELTEATRIGEIAAFAMRTRDGIATDTLGPWDKEIREFHELAFWKIATVARCSRAAASSWPTLWPRRSSKVVNAFFACHPERSVTESKAESARRLWDCGANPVQQPAMIYGRATGSFDFAQDDR